MAEWIEVPAHRVLQLTVDEFRSDFEILDRDGNAYPGDWIISNSAMARRKRDGKLFRDPRFHIARADFGRVMFLEEV